MWFTELVAIVGFAVVIPLLPLYVRDLGVEGEGQVAMWSGAVFSAQAVTMAIFAPIWGALSDRYGRKVMVERAIFAGTVIMALMGLAQSPFQLIVLRAMQGALTGTVTASRALVATSAPKDRAGYALGMLQVAVYVGATAGPLLGGVIADAVGYRTPFFVTSALLLIAATAVAIVVKEPTRSTRVTVDQDGARSHGRQSLRGRVLNHLRPVLDSAPILAVLGVGVLVRSAARMAQPTLPLFVEAVAPPDARIATITGLIIGASAIGGALGGWRLGGLGDRVGYRRIMIACALGSVAFYAPQSLASKWGWLVPLQLGAGFAMGGILSSMGASLATLSPDGREGLVYGVEATALSIAKAVGPAAGSMVAAWFGLWAPFVGAALVFALGGLVAFRRMPDLRPRQPESETETDRSSPVPMSTPCDAATGCADVCDISPCNG
jgi:DHA1 family multidrug resistance protein-like MFS transporter